MRRLCARELSAVTLISVTNHLGIVELLCLTIAKFHQFHYLLLPQWVNMDKCILIIKLLNINESFPVDRYYQIHTNGLILMNTPRRVDTEKSIFRSMSRKVNWQINIDIWTLTNPSWLVNIDISTHKGWYQLIYKKILMNLHWQVDIDQSIPMGSYWWIYNDEQISVNQHQCVDITKSTPLSRYWQMHTDMLWCQCESTPMVDKNKSTWQVDIDKSTLLSWYLWIYPLNLYQLIYTEESTLMNPCPQININ